VRTGLPEGPGVHFKKSPHWLRSYVIYSNRIQIDHNDIRLCDCPYLTCPAVRLSLGRRRTRSRKVGEPTGHGERRSNLARQRTKTMAKLKEE